MRKLYLFIIALLVLIASGFYFYQKYETSEPVNISSADSTMLKTNSLRHTFKVSLMSQKGFIELKDAILQQDEDKVFDALDFFAASIGFVESAYVSSGQLKTEVKPILEKIIKLVEVKMLQLSPEELEVIAQEIENIFFNVEKIDRDIWTKFQQEYINFKTDEYYVRLLYQIIGVLIFIFLLVSIFYLYRQRSLNAELIVQKEEVSKNESQLRQALIAVDAGSFSYNMLTGDIAWDARSIQMFGFTLESFEYSFDNWKACLIPEDYEAVKDDIEMVAQDNGPNVLDIHYRILVDNSIKHIHAQGYVQRDNNGSALSMNGLHFDVTHQKETDKLLLDSREELNNYKDQLEQLVEERTKELLVSKQETDKAMERFNEVMLATEDGIWDWNILTSEVYYSPSWQTMLGYEVGEIEQVVESWNKLLHPDDLDRVMEHATNFITNKSNLYHIEFRMLCKDGSYTWVLARAKDAERDEKGHVTRIIGTHVDIQEKKELEEKLSLINKNLEKRVEAEVLNNLKKDKQMLHQSRLAQMGEMISMIAHQWRQPLSSISATIGSLQMKQMLGKYDKEFYDEQLNNIAGFSQHLSKTIDDFKNFYKPDKESDSIKLEEVISKALDITKALIVNYKIEIIEEYNSKEEIELYITEIMQVILNILKNAQDNFMGKDIKDPYIKIITNDRTISICDNGGGIPDDIIDKIFDPYFSTKDEKNGTGLGLYMSKTIVEEHHNGKLKVENTDDGVCFKIEFI